MLKYDPFAVGRNRGPRALCHFKRQLLRPAAVAIRSPDLKHTRAVRMKYDVAIVRRNYGRIISSALRCQRSFIAASCRDFEDVGDAARIGRVENLVVGRDGKIIVTTGAGTDRRRFGFIGTQQPETRKSLRLHGDERAAIRAQTEFAIVAEIARDGALRSV